MALSRTALFVSVAVHSGVGACAVCWQAGQVPGANAQAVITIQRLDEAVVLVEDTPPELAEVAVERTAAPIERAPTEVPEPAAPPFRAPVEKVDPSAPLVEVLGPVASDWLARVRPVEQQIEPEPLSVEPEQRNVEEIDGQNPPPPYPMLARRRGMEGTVVLAVTVDTAGKVLQCWVKDGSNHSVLDKAAACAVRGWRFRYGPGTTDVTVKFVLRG